jgi:hypothetical protein
MASPAARLGKLPLLPEEVGVESCWRRAQGSGRAQGQGGAWTPICAGARVQVEFFAEEDLVTIVPNPNFYEREEDDTYMQFAAVRRSCAPQLLQHGTLQLRGRPCRRCTST